MAKAAAKEPSRAAPAAPAKEAPAPQVDLPPAEKEAPKGGSGPAKQAVDNE